MVTLVVELVETDPATAVPDEFLSVKLMELDCTGSLKVAVGAVDTATPVAPDAGVLLVTEGGAASVVKDQENGAVMVTLDVLSAPLMVAV